MGVSISPAITEIEAAEPCCPEHKRRRTLAYDFTCKNQDVLVVYEQVEVFWNLNRICKNDDF